METGACAVTEKDHIEAALKNIIEQAGENWNAPRGEMVQYKSSNEQFSVTSTPLRDIGLYQEWQKQANLAGSGNFPSFHEWLTLQVISLRHRLAMDIIHYNLIQKIQDKLMPYFTQYAMTSEIMEVIDRLIEWAQENEQLLNRAEAAEKELATEIEHYQKALDRAVAMEQGWDAAEERVGRLAETMTQLATELSNFETPLRDENGYCPKHTIELAWGETCSGYLWDEINKIGEILQAALTANAGPK